MEYLCTDEAGKINLSLTIENLRGGVESEKRKRDDWRIFLNKWGGEMSLWDYTDYKETMHGHGEKARDYEQAIALIERIKQAEEGDAIS